jgi:hypothetical protein
VQVKHTRTHTCAAATHSDCPARKPTWESGERTVRVTPHWTPVSLAAADEPCTSCK